MVNSSIIRAMKQILCLSIILILSFSIGCGSSGGSSNPVSSVVSPSITTISPLTGGPGTIVSIQGTGFGAIQGSGFVSYGGITVQPSSWSNTLITVTIPQNATSGGSFIVSVGGVSSNSSPQFTQSSPTISYISPASGNPGIQVVITGQYFGTSQGSSYVAFNGQQAQIINWSSTAITCLVPNFSSAQTGSLPVVVWLDGTKMSNTSTFSLTYPAITSVSPSADNIGATISIYGQGFGQNQSLVNGSVLIGGSNAQVVNWGENFIQAKIPQISGSGAKAIVVNVSGKQITNSIRVEAPIANSHSPNPADNGSLLTISGAYFGNSSDDVSRSVSIQDYGVVTGVNYYDNSLSFTWPISNSLFGTQTKTVTISIGGLSTNFTVTAN